LSVREEKRGERGQAGQNWQIVIPGASGRETEKPICKQGERSKGCDHPEQRLNVSKGVGGNTKYQNEGEPPARDIETTASEKKVIARGEKRSENKHQVRQMEIGIVLVGQVTIPGEQSARRDKLFFIAVEFPGHSAHKKAEQEQQEKTRDA